jgi:hypothetical protein
MSMEAGSTLHEDAQRRWRLARRAAALAGALPLAGCRLDDMLRSDRQTILWLVLPLLGFCLVGTILIYYRRRRQLTEWDLRTSPEEPSYRTIVQVAIAIAAGITIAFAAYNLLAIRDLAPKQLMLNIGYWLAGTLAGGTVAVVGGLKLAEPRRASLPRSGRH